ncbi:type II CAAX endopeptidase family protein [Longispora sp. NPDC051575]|uniref:CPBP family intramembrane glutamic endopeptidase n=1 Tax=Longispora sp. NPDC051575 TaxID=3154943 RepID=UPI00342527A4
MTADGTSGGDRWRFEDPGTDFPYYDGRPVALTTRQWWLVVAAVAVAFAVLIAPIRGLNGTYTQLIPALVFAALPLAVLAWAAPGHWTALFRRVRARDVGWMVGFWLLNLVVTFVVGGLVSVVFGTKANPAVEGVGDLDTAGRVMFFLKTLPQLLGEELLTVLPFLALLTWLHTRKNLSRKRAVLLSWLLTALMFGALHLPTYDWQVAQALIGIGAARVVLTAAYIKTKNLWVSTGAHVLNDWSLFALAL